VLAAYELDAAMPPEADVARLLELMRRDKKALDGLTFVLDGANGVEVIAGVDPALAASMLEAM